MLLVTGGGRFDFLSSTEVSLSPGGTNFYLWWNWQTISFHCVHVQTPTSCARYIKNIETKQSGGRLFPWQPTGVEGGGGRTASPAKCRTASHLGRGYPLCHRWSGRWQGAHLHPGLGPSGWVLATSRRPCCFKRPPCCCCPSSFKYCHVL